MKENVLRTYMYIHQFNFLQISFNFQDLQETNVRFDKEEIDLTSAF